MAILLLFIAIPMIEIALFIKVGGLLGLWPTLAVVLLTALIGTHLLRAQGKNVLQNLNNSISNMRNPASDLAHGAMLIFGAALLLTPGFFTDAIGLGLMVPSVREYAMQKINARIATYAQAASTRQSADQNAKFYDADFENITPKPTHAPDKPSSNWTRH